MRRRAFARGLAPAVLVAALAVLVALLGAPAAGVAAQAATPAATPAAGDRAGVAGATYASPGFGWRLAWDEEVWRVEEAWSRGGTDRLRLSTGSGAGAAAVTFSAFRGHGGDAGRCIRQPIAFRPAQPGTTDVRVVHGPEGGAGRTRVELAFVYTDPGGRARAIREYAECRALAPGEAVLVVDFFAPAETYPEHRRALEALLAAVVLPGVVAPGATPGATPAP